MSMVLFFLLIIQAGYGQARPKGNIDIFCDQLIDAYCTKTSERDYKTIIKIYLILERDFRDASTKEKEKIVRTIQKGFQFDSPPDAVKDYRVTGAESLMTMDSLGLKTLLSSVKQNKIHIVRVDRLVTILRTEYEKKKSYDEEKIDLIYSIFEEIFFKMDSSVSKKIVGALGAAFNVKTPKKEGEFKIKAANCLSGMETLGLYSLLSGAMNHKAQKLSYPKTKWSQVVKTLRDVLFTEYGKRKKCDEEKVLLIFNIYTVLYSNFSGNEQKSITSYISKGAWILPSIQKEACMVTGAECLAKMGKNGLRTLESLLKGEKLEGDWIVLEAVIIAIGSTKSRSSLDTICQLLWNDYGVIVNAACSALALYSNEPLKVRKPIVKDLVKVFANLYNLGGSKNPSITNARKYSEVRDHLNMVLKKLTNRQFTTAPEWQKWFNNNKGKSGW